MDDAALVRGREPARDLDGEVNRLGRREPLVLQQAIAERLAFEQLHHRIDDARLVPDVVEREDVWMVQSRHRTRLALEAREPIGVALGLGGEHLDGDLAAEARVAGAIDLAHPAAANRADDFVGSETCADGYGVERAQSPAISWLGSARCGCISRSLTAFAVIWGRAAISAR